MKHFTAHGDGCVHPGTHRHGRRGETETEMERHEGLAEVGIGISIFGISFAMLAAFLYTML